MSIAGCHQPDEPYLWIEHATDVSAAMTADGGPVWAWPGTIHDGGMLAVQRKASGAIQLAFAAEHGGANLNSELPRVGGDHTVWGPYYPPVPCADFDSGKYEPDYVDGNLTVASYERWMPAVGLAPFSGWTNPNPGKYDR